MDSKSINSRPVLGACIQRWKTHLSPQGAYAVGRKMDKWPTNDTAVWWAIGIGHAGEGWQVQDSGRQVVKYGQGSLGLSWALKDEELFTRWKWGQKGVPVGSARMRSHEGAWLGTRMAEKLTPEATGLKWKTVGRRALCSALSCSPVTVEQCGGWMVAPGQRRKGKTGLDRRNIKEAGSMEPGQGKGNCRGRLPISGL